MIDETEQNDENHVLEAVERQVECFDRVISKIKDLVHMKIRESKPNVEQAISLLNEQDDAIDYKTACMLMQAISNIYKINAVSWLDDLLNSRDDGFKYKLSVHRARISGIVTP